MKTHIIISFGILVWSIATLSKAKEKVDDEKPFTLHDEEYDFIDDGDDNNGHQGGGNDLNNYTYSYQEYDNGTESESEVDFVPELISQSRNIIAKTGDLIELPCKASDSAIFVRIWKKDDTMLFTGSVKYSRDQALARFHLDPNDNTTLVIDEIQPEDSGAYTCRIMIRERDTISLKHYVTVSDSFTIQTNPPDGLVTLDEGGQTTLSCFASGGDCSYNISQLRWTREGTAFPDGNFSLHSPQYQILNATRDDAGFYFCTFTSCSGESRSAEIEVRVQFGPAVTSLQKSVVKSGRGLMVEFACSVVGEPAPKVLWYKGEEVVALSGRVTSQKAGIRHLLVINRVRSDDVGTYMCYATNDIGSGQKGIVFDSQDITEPTKDNESGNTRNVDNIIQKLASIKASLIEDKDEFLAFKKRCEGDLASLKNLTLNVLQSFKSGDPYESSGEPSRTSFDISLFADLERLTQEIRHFQTTFGQSIKELNMFKQSSSQEMERIWDQVNDLQELSNTTSKNLDELFDKDILPLQNFRQTIQHEVNKLRIEFSTLMETLPTTATSQNGRLDSDNSNPSQSSKVDQFENDLIRLRNSILKMDDAQNLHRDEMMRVFRDVDGLKKHQQVAEREQLKMQRDIARLESQDLADINSKLKVYDDKFEDIIEFQSLTKQTLIQGSTTGDEKFNLLMAEMLNLKKQIFYLQQSYLQLRVGSSSSTAPPPDSNNPISRPAVQPKEDQSLVVIEEKLLKVEQGLNSCVPTEKFDQLTQSISEREAQSSGELQQVRDKLQHVQEVAKSVEVGIQDTNSRVNRNVKRVEMLEVHSKKYNLILSGLPVERKLERHQHLEKIVSDFFTDTLAIDNISFDEAERFIDPSGEWSKPVRIKFPNLKTKVSVLQASRDPDVARILREKQLAVVEDFTNAVKFRRRRLAAFARQRARAKKLKWALKNDELFFNGKTFIFNEQLNRVILKPSASKDKLNESPKRESV